MSSKITLLAVTARPLLFPKRGMCIVLRDVYKECGYVAPYTVEESEKILAVINQTSRSEDLLEFMTKKRAELLVKDKDLRREPYSRVEQLLDVKTFQPNILEKACRSILNKSLKEEQKLCESNSEAVDKPLPNLALRYGKKIKPVVSVKEQLSIKTIVGIKFNLNHLSYAKVTRDQDVGDIENDSILTSWNSIPVFKDGHDKEEFEHHNFLTTVREVYSQIPIGDVYIIEELPGILSKDQFASMKAKQMAFEASLLTLLSQSRSHHKLRDNHDDQPGEELVPIHCLKSSILDTMFRLKVGTERTSVSSRFNSMARSNLDGETSIPFRYTLAFNLKFVQDHNFVLEFAGFN